MDRFDSIGNFVSKFLMFFHFLLIIPLVSDCLVWRNGKQPRGLQTKFISKVVKATFGDAGKATSDTSWSTEPVRPLNRLSEHSLSSMAVIQSYFSFYSNTNSLQCAESAKG